MGTRNKSRVISVFVATLSLLVGVSSSLVGSTFQSSEKNIHISHLHHIDDDLYTACKNLNVNGTISGDLSSIGESIVIKGEIGGSANFLCRTAINNGQIRKSVRFFGEQLTQNGRIDGSLIAAGNEIVLEPGSMIQKDVNIACAKSYIDGVIKGNLTAYSGEIKLGGLIEGDVEIESDDITFTPPLVIKGNFSYTAPNEIDIDNLTGVTILGDINRIEEIIEADDDDGSTIGGLLLKLPRLVATFLFGFLLIKIFNRQIRSAINEMTSRTPISFAAGIAGIIVLIMSIGLLLISIITALIGIGVMENGSVIGGWIAIVFASVVIPTSGAVSAVLILIIFCSESVCGLLFGHLILKRIKPDAAQVSALGLFVGLIALLLLTMIPYLGPLIFILGLLLCIGGIILGIKKPLPRN